MEPNPDLTPLLTNTRPGDTVLTVGIGTSGVRETLDYYRLSESSWNTFSREQADHCVKVSGGKVTIKEVVKTPLVPINEVIAQHFPAGARTSCRSMWRGWTWRFCGRWTSTSTGRR